MVICIPHVSPHSSAHPSYRAPTVIYIPHSTSRPSPDPKPDASIVEGTTKDGRRYYIVCGKDPSGRAVIVFPPAEPASP